MGGPTDLYNLFDDPQCDAPSIQQLRAIHRDLEGAVLEAYGWDLELQWDFERPWIDGTWRYVPVAAQRRELLARLAKRNATQFDQEYGLILDHVATALAAGLPKDVKKARTALAAVGIKLSADEVRETLTRATTDDRFSVHGKALWPATLAQTPTKRPVALGGG